jgi:four helix bundle protein
MKEKNVVVDKSFALAIRIVNAYKFLKKEKEEYVLSKQLLRSGTSIGANIEEAVGAQSKADFVSKLSIAYKEARETLYWIKLLVATDYLTSKTGHSLINDIDELCKIIGTIQITTKKNIRNS